MKASASLQSESRKDSSMSRRIATAGVELIEVRILVGHIDLYQAGEETAKDQVAACIEKFINGLNEDLKKLLSLAEM